MCIDNVERRAASKRAKHWEWEWRRYSSMCKYNRHNPNLIIKKEYSNGKANKQRQSEAKVQLQWNETSIINTNTHTHTHWFLFSFIYEYLEKDNRINITAYEYVEVSRRRIHGKSQRPRKNLLKCTNTMQWNQLHYCKCRWAFSPRLYNLLCCKWEWRSLLM